MAGQPVRRRLAVGREGGSLRRRASPRQNAAPSGAGRYTSVSGRGGHINRA